MIGQVYHLTPSYRLSAAFLSLTILSLICILILPWSGWIKVILTVSMLVYCHQQWQHHVFLKDSQALVAFCLKKAGVWQLTNRLQQQQMARLLSKTRCTRHVVILHFQSLPSSIGRTQSYSLFILSDSLQNQAFKSLRRQLRMLGEVNDVL